MIRPAGSRHPLRTLRRLQTILAVVLGGIVLAIILYALIHMKRPSGPEPQPDDFVPQKVEVQENARHLEFNRDLSRMEIKAPRNYLGQDGLYHLEGGVDIHDRGKKGGRDLHIKAPQATYDKDMTKIVFSGGVSIESKGLTMTAAGFVYDKIADTVTNDTGVSMRSSRFQGRARAFSYTLTDETFVLDGDLEFSYIPQIGEDQPLIVRGSRMKFNYQQRRGRIEGPVDLRHGRSRGHADVLEIQLFPGKDDLHMLFLMGGAQITLRETPTPARGRRAPPAPDAKANPGSYQSLFLFDSSDQDISADSVLIVAFPDVKRLRIVRARGRAAFVLASADGKITRIQGEAATFYFRAERGLRNMTVRGGARLLGVSKEVPEGRSVEAPFLAFDGKVLNATGDARNPSRSRAEKREIQAENLSFFFQTNGLDAWVGVKVAISDIGRTDQPSGLFNSSRPVFGRARFFRFDEKNGTFVFHDNARLWQDKQVLEGQAIVVGKETQAVRADRGVKFLFSHAPKAGGAEERIEVGGERMDYDPQGRTATFTGKSSLKTKDIDLTAASISVIPDAEPGQARLIKARGNVFVLQRLRRATGDAADYDVPQETIVMTGHAVLIDPDKGTIPGDKLTFHLADGNIRVENRDQQRSDVIIKS